jgi:hypothetical protein
VAVEAIVSDKKLGPRRNRIFLSFEWISKLERRSTGRKSGADILGVIDNA